MKLTKGIISRKQALAISQDYVAFVEGNFGRFTIVLSQFNTLRHHQKAITYVDGQFVKVKVTSIRHNDIRAVDGPIVRVGNGEYTWRVDGDRFAFPRK
jgi:hypothetical protein